jgi:hypothetical protein
MEWLVAPNGIWREVYAKSDKETKNRFERGICVIRTVLFLREEGVLQNERIMICYLSKSCKFFMM